MKKKQAEAIEAIAAKQRAAAAVVVNAQKPAVRPTVSARPKVASHPVEGDASDTNQILRK
jgi:hypothetical protein